MKTFIKVVALLLTLCMFIPCLAACELVSTNNGNNSNNNGDNSNNNGDNSNNNGDNSNNNGDNSNNNGDNSNNNGDNSNNNGDNSNNNGDNSNNNGDNSNNNGGDSTDDDRDGLPEKVDMKGYTYNAYVHGTASGNGDFYCEDFWVDPTTGGADALSYAVIQRNNEIEKDYNCTIKQTWSTQDNMYTEMDTFYQSNQKYELAILLAADAATCAVKGLLSDLNASVNSDINLMNAAFDQNSIEHMTLGENLYFLSGDMNISTMDCTVATVFNKDYYDKVKKNLVDKLGDEMYGDLYEMVADGTWTLDNMLKMANQVTDDVDDSDGGLSYEKGDTIGYFQYAASPLYYYYAAGMRITSTSGGYPTFDIINDENAQEVYEYLFDRLNVKKNTNLPTGYSAKRAENFLSGQVLFTDYILWDIRTQLYPKATDLYYGILPNPTKDGGTDYYSCVYFEATVHLWAIPTLRENTEYAARMFEVMAAYSASGRDSTMDAYYVKTMYMKVARDDGSRASLDIIRGCLVYDIALMYSGDRAGNQWGNFDNLLLSAADAANYEYASYTTEAKIANAESQLQATIDAFKEMSGK